jgi:hypothetical protein
VKRLRLFHFDIKTYGNYGDTLLFEAVRETFNGFGDGRCFDVVDSRPLRAPVGPRLVDYINANFDAVVVGGGGLFLRDTNQHSRSGWQWNISMEQLRRLTVPLIVFAVGNNRFMGQPDFRDPFREHVNLTLEKSVFFGLRNTGSVETIREYVDTAQRHRVVYQPCPTTIASYLYPDLYRPQIENRRLIGAQSIVGKRQATAGFDAEAIYRTQVEVLGRLAGEGWDVLSLPHARADMGFHARLVDKGVATRSDVLWGDRHVLFRGLERFNELPVMLGTRGHAQMVPFGMGAVPLSLHVHDKTRYFATDIGHPEWAVDPRADDFAERLYRLAHEVHERQPELRDELAQVRERFYRLTLDNLATVYERLTGVRVEPGFRPLDARGRLVAGHLYVASLARDTAESTPREETREIDRLRASARVTALRARASLGEMALLRRAPSATLRRWVAASRLRRERRASPHPEPAPTPRSGS